jgi:hypothetical protein
MNQPAAAAVATQRTDGYKGINTGQPSDKDPAALRVVFSVLTWIWAIAEQTSVRSSEPGTELRHGFQLAFQMGDYICTDYRTE